MIFKRKKHNPDLYNTLLKLSRNIFFYDKMKLPDTFETRIYLMFLHFSIMMIVFKEKGVKFDQDSYDFFFNSIENNLRELGFGDVSVNKKMKDLNKLLYDILLKLKDEKTPKFSINENLIFKYFIDLKNDKTDKIKEFKSYFTEFYEFCFELSLDNMLREAIKFKK